MSTNGHKVRIGKLSEFRPQSVNANKHTERGLRMLDDAMSEDGYVAPMTAVADAEIIDGSARLERAFDKFNDEAIILEHDGTRPIITVRTDIPNANTKEAKRIAVRANRIAEVDLEWDASVLAELAESKELEGMFSDKELAEILTQTGIEPKDAEPQIDKAEELRQKWGTESGQLWVIGNHRLLVGDATNKADVGRLCANELADCGFSDPPYGISYKSGTWSVKRKATLKALENDDLRGEEFIQFLRSFYALQREVTSGDIYVCCDWKSYPEFLDALTPLDKLTNVIVWNKRFQTQALNTFAFAHEFILFFGDNGGPYKDVNVWTVDREFNDLHATPKPVELVQKALTYSCRNAVTDFFAGSGTTLVAAENLNRKCYAMEISPAYVAVCLERMATAFPSLQIEKVDQARAA